MAYAALQHSSRTRLLAADEEQQLAKVIERGRLAEARIDRGAGCGNDADLVSAGRDARRRFMEANLGLVLSIVGSFRVPAQVDREDMVQDGMVGLESAVSRFEWRRGLRFSTYATWRIRQAIQRGLENTATTVRIPAHRHGELRAAIASLDDPSSVSSKAAALAAIGTTESLDRPIAESGATLADLVPAEDDGPAAAALRAIDLVEVEAVLGQLDQVTTDAVTRRFGLDGGDPATFAEIGDVLGVSAEAARRRVARAIELIRTNL